MAIITDTNNLAKYISKIQTVFSVQDILRQRIDEDFVIDYYRNSASGYSIFHSSEGAVHMALNFDGKYAASGFYEQATQIDELIKQTKSKTVLELGSGKGFNSIFLAGKNPGIKFVGLDLTPVHVEEATSKGMEFPNLSFDIGSFQEMKYQDKSFDLVFEIESVCHASNMDVALKEIYRVLKQDGLFISFDGFRGESYEESSEDVKIAAKLTEISMAIERPMKINVWLDLAKRVGFEVVTAEDISRAILPNLGRFQFLARGFYKYPSIAKLLLRLLSPHLVKNSIAGLLMPFTIEAGAQVYYKTVLRRDNKMTV